MPITRREFIKGSFKRKAPNRIKHPIASFLKKNKNKAYTVKEIIKELLIKENTVRSMLRELKKDAFVAHKPPYFAWRIK